MSWFTNILCGERKNMIVKAWWWFNWFCGHNDPFQQAFQHLFYLCMHYLLLVHIQNICFLAAVGFSFIQKWVIVQIRSMWRTMSFPTSVQCCLCMLHLSQTSWRAPPLVLHWNSIQNTLQSRTGVVLPPTMLSVLSLLLVCTYG